MSAKSFLFGKAGGCAAITVSAITLAALAGDFPARAAAEPGKSISVYQETEGGRKVTWTFQGREGKLTAANGDTADLTLSTSPDGRCIDVHRTSTSAMFAKDLQADYHGCLTRPNHFEGNVVFVAPSKNWVDDGKTDRRPKVAWEGDLEIITGPVALERGMAALRTPDKAGARRWFETAVQLDDTTARQRLGEMLHEGVGGSRDMSGARALFEQGAKAGRGDSAYALGQMMELGEAGPVDTQDARRMYEQALAAHFGPALPRLVLFERNDYTPQSIAQNPDWQLDEHTLRDNGTVVHTLSTQIAEGTTRFVLATQCVTTGISAADGVNFALWLLSDSQPPLYIAAVKHRRRGTHANAGTPPLAQRYQPERWTLIGLPAASDETLEQFANQARWNDLISRLSLGFGWDGDVAIDLRDSRLSPEEQEQAAHYLSARRLLRLYQLLFRQPRPEDGLSGRDVMQVELLYKSQGGRDDQMAQTHKIFSFDLTKLDSMRHSFLEDACQMNDPFADPAVRTEHPDPG